MNIYDNTMSRIKENLDVATLNSKVISNNIANINTENYKKFYVVYEDSLKKSGELELKETKDKHMQLNGSSGDVQVKRDESTSMRSDGNNVDLDMEKVNQAANTLLYNALITQANGKIATSRYVITGGGN